jgi:putative redox protein
MNSKLSWDGMMGFTAIGDSGHPIRIDLDPANGGNGAGARPMELLLHALGGCSGVDVVSILNKMRQKLESFVIEIEGNRAEDHPRRYTRINMTFRMKGPGLDPQKARHAVELSMTKYCSVAGSLNADISYEVDVES